MQEIISIGKWSINVASSLASLFVILTILHLSHGLYVTEKQTSHVGLSQQHHHQLCFLPKIEPLHSSDSSIAAIDSDNRLEERATKRLLLPIDQVSERLDVKPDRVDPLDRWRKYKGGYDIHSKHYLASTVFTGIYGYVIGAIWLLAGIIGTSIRYILYCRSNPARNSLSEKDAGDLSEPENGQTFVWLFPAVFLTAMVIACCGIILGGNQRFYSTGKEVERTIIVHGAENATQMIHNVTSVMGAMKVEIEPYDANAARRLDNTTTKLDKAAVTLLETVDNHKSTIDTALIALKISIAAIASMNLAIVLVALACFIVCHKWRRIFYLMVAIAWFLIFVNWMAFGLTFAVSNFADDTCEALKEYQQSSRNTTLDTLLPCASLSKGSQTMLRMRQKIYNYVIEANKNISKLKNGANNQFIQCVCNPFSGPPGYKRSSNCSAGTIPVSDLPQLLQQLRCPDDSSSINITASHCVPNATYNAAVAYIHATENLLNLIPQVDSLTNCSFMVETFSIIVKQYCRPLKNSIKTVSVAMLILSVLLTTSQIMLLATSGCCCWSFCNSVQPPQKLLLLHSPQHH